MFRAPTQLPPLSYLLDDLKTRDLKKIARHLDISESTLRRYIKEEQAPHAVMLALFWETRWGFSILDVDIDRWEKHYNGMISALEGKVARLEALVRHFADDSHDEAANAPVWDVATCKGTVAAGRANRSARRSFALLETPLAVSCRRELHRPAALAGSLAPGFDALALGTG